MTRHIEVRIRGPLADDAVERLGLTRISRPTDTFLRAVVADRPALHGVLDRLRCNGIELIDVRPLPGPGKDAP
jgi:hypothetical protein